MRNEKPSRGARYASRWVRVAWALAASASAAACGLDLGDPPGPTCVPGDEQECVCLANGAGRQVCQVDGTWSECLPCGQEPAADADEPPEAHA